MPNVKKISDALDKIIKALFEFKDALNEDVKTELVEVPHTQIVETKEEKQIIMPADDNFESLKKALESEKWPEAVNPNLICDPNNEQDKLERGRGIVELMIEPDLKDLKVLDFGCGEGHVAFVATEYEPTFVVGYDNKENNKWSAYEQKENLLFTNDFEKVLEKGPYDVVVIFDVLDHCKYEDPISLLKKARDVLAENGQIYMRCHPFVSKHGTHLYHQLNKAYAHLVFTKEELEQLVPNQNFVEESIGVKFPLATYDKFIKEAQLETVHRREITSNVDNFFKIPKIAERIISQNGFESFPEFQMSLDFVDYVLKK